MMKQYAEPSKRPVEDGGAGINSSALITLDID